MLLPRFLRPGRSRSQTPPRTDSHNVDAPAPKHSLHIRKFFQFGRSRSKEFPQADSNSSEVASSSLASPKPAQGNLIAAHHDTPNPSASPPSHSSQPATSLIESNTTQNLDPNGSNAPPFIHRVSPSPAAGSDPGGCQGLSLLPQPAAASISQQSLPFPRLTMFPRQHSPQSLDGNSYPSHAGQNVLVIQESRSVSVDGNNNNVNYTNSVVTKTVVNNANNFMAELWRETIQGAAFDSSVRDPPPRCHPGTRLAVIARCLEFIANATDKKKLRWVVGQAGVGKSAIMQNVAESPLPSVSERASIFLSINGRNDGAKIIMTLIYQLADQCEPYREFVEHEITRHPSLLRSSMSVQFNKFIIEPFIHHPQLKHVGRVLIIIDGLDECDKSDTQRELLRLIADVCSTHPSLSLVWLIASRPEHHITSFFDQDHIRAVYEKEVIEVDSDEARSDVERFLRAEMTRIQQEFSLSPGSQWPPEQDLWKLASASGGLFVYAQVAVKYIGDRDFADPVSQLKDVLAVIDANPLPGVPRDQHPMALLDALYTRILSKIPERIMVNTRKILLAMVFDSGRHPSSRKGGFLGLCNWLGMTYDEAYAAIRHLNSVLLAPKPDKACKEKLRAFHKSFVDYLSDFIRSGFSSDIAHEAQQLEDQYAIRILEQAPEGIDCGDMVDDVLNSSGNVIGHLVSVPGAGFDIELTWSADEDSNWSDDATKSEMYKWAFANVVEGIRASHSAFCTEFYIRIVVRQLWRCSEANFPYWQLVNLVFEKPRSREFIKSGLLKRVSIKSFYFDSMTWKTKLHFRRPRGTMTNVSDPWNPSCEHERTGDWGEGKDEDWMTEFRTMQSPVSGCHFCCERLDQQIENWKIRFPDGDVTLLLTSFPEGFIEFHFINPDDGVSEWTYWITLVILEEMRI